MTTIGASRGFPTLRYAFAPFRWFFGSRRRVLTTAAVLVAMIAAPVIWWFIQLLGLPDIGDPFDVEAFRSSTIPDERNAFLIYRQAADRLEPLNTTGLAQGQRINLRATWSQVAPFVRRWVEANREAMECFRRGTERPDALDPALATDPDSSWKTTQALGWFHDLAMLEGSRLEEEGDMAGAWGWYRAALRASEHMRLVATAVGRMRAQSWDGQFRGRFSLWAADPRTTPALIRRALDDVIACGDFVPSDLTTLKLEYLSEEGLIKDSYNPGRQALVAKLNAQLASRGYQLDLDRVRAIADAWRFWRREPERSRRMIRLAFANWLAYLALPPARRPAPDPGVSGAYEFYAFGPEAPDKARALSPEALDRWLQTTYNAREILRSWKTDIRPLRARDRANHRALVVLLASELYRRDHGTDPPSDEALVGPYLKSLPDDGAEEAGTRGSTGQE
jgi:hypothetical protein